MSKLTATRGYLAEALAGVSAGVAGVQVFTYVPESIPAPALVIQPGSPYLTSEGEPFGHYRVRFVVTVVAEVATNATTTAQLDDLISECIERMSGAFQVEEVREPFVYMSNTVSHLAADLVVSDSIDFD